jgi:hypothetical protein
MTMTERRLILSLCAILTAAIACDSGVTEPTIAGATRSRWDRRRRRSIRRSGRATATAVVVVKSSKLYALHVNVAAGQVLQTPSTNHNGKPQDISHVSRFVCQK